MRHIDDGALHAYLDGAHDLIGADGGVDALEAHLAECAGCRARLEEERAVREAASAILGLGAPRATALPPFAALEGRARERGPADGDVAPAGATGGVLPGARSGAGQREPRRWRAVPLAWAATVVLALGAGWIAREVLENPGAERLSAVTAVEPEPQSAASRSGATGASGGPEQEAGRRPGDPRPEAEVAGAGTGEAVRSAAPTPTPGAAPVPREVAALDVAADAAAADRFAAGEREAELLERRQMASTAPPPAAGSAVSPTADPPPPAMADDVAGRVAAAPEQRVTAETIPPPAPLGEPVESARYRQTATAMPAAPPPPPVAPAVPPVRPAAVALEEVVVTGESGAGDPVWRPIERQAAEGALGQPILVLAGLPVISVDAAGTGPRTTVRIRQRLETGEVVTLTQSLQDPPVGPVDPAGPPAPAEARVAVRAESRPAPREIAAGEDAAGAYLQLREGDLVIEATAPIPLDRLRALVVRLR